MSACVFESENWIPTGWLEATGAFYYDGRKYHLDTGGKYVPMDQASVRRHMKRWGIDGDDIGNALCKIQVDRFVSHVGPLAGKRRGLYEYGGHQVLASVNPEIIESGKGPFPTINRFLRGLFADGDHGQEQLVRFMGWMKCARLAMLAGERRPGQALILAGPIQCGKTQLAKQIIIPGMGGRDAQPLRYLSGRNNFNGDLIGAEVLLIDDEMGSTRIDVRRNLGDGIKNALFSPSVRVEAKGRDAFTFPALWRVVFTVNDEPEALMVLPPLTRDLADKFMILKCSKSIEFNDAEFDDWQKQIREEMPAFLHAVENFEIPEHARDGRCMVGAFCHPEVVDAIGELSPEHQLRSMIDTVRAGGGISLPWEGTAAQLKAILMAPGSGVARDAEKLLGNWAAATGVYLGRLTDGRGVEKLTIREGDQFWRIGSGGAVDMKDETTIEE